MLNRHVDDIIMENGKVAAVKSQGEVRSRSAAIICAAIYHDIYYYFYLYRIVDIYPITKQHDNIINWNQIFYVI